MIALLIIGRLRRCDMVQILYVEQLPTSQGLAAALWPSPTPPTFGLARMLKRKKAAILHAEGGRLHERVRD
jgi:hypothetical protein